MKSSHKLVSELLKRSFAKDWANARLEWSCVDIFMSEEPQICLCGHSPIMEICVIKNSKNQAMVEIGNSCVKQFLGKSYENIFSSIRRITKDRAKSVSLELLDFSIRQKIITQWEYEFYYNIRLKRGLTQKQLAKKEAINKTILSSVKK